MKKIFYLTIMFLIMGCSQNKQSVVLTPDSPVLLPYKTEFYNLSDGYFTNTDNIRSRDIPAGFSDLGFGDGSTSIVGKCVIYKYSDGSSAKELLIDTAFWQYTQDQFGETTFNGELLREASRRIVVFHELGHCTLERITHDCAKSPGGTNLSMMNVTVIPNETFISDKPNFISELFINSPLFPVDRVTYYGESKATVPAPETCPGEGSGGAVTIGTVSEDVTYERVEYLTKCIKNAEKINRKNLLCWHETP